MPSTDSIKALAAVTDHTDRLKRMMARAKSVSGHTNQDLAEHWAKNIAGYLYQRCKQFSPTAEMFGIGPNSIAVKHGWRIANLGKNHQKLPSPWSKTRVADIMRQRGNHRLFIASGWLAVKKIVSKSGERLQTAALRNGKVVVDIQDGVFTKVSVTISNTSDYARSFHEKNGIVDLALEDEREDLAEYVSRKTHETVAEILKTT